MNSLREFCRGYNIELLSEDIDNIRGKSRELFTYRKIDCGHIKTSRICNIKRNGAVCNEFGGCDDQILKTKYYQLGLDINFDDCSINCTECGRKYYREQSKLKKFLDKYSCYCKLNDSHESIVYQKLLDRFGDKLIRSYSKYKVQGKNYSADFYIRQDGVDYIIALDDISHLGAINRARDLDKLAVQLGKDNTYSIYIQQSILFRGKTMELLEDRMEQVMDEIEDYIRDNNKEKVVFMMQENSNFYDYMFEAIGGVHEIAYY